MKQKVVAFGEVMLRLAPPGYSRFAQAGQFVATIGGAEANVAVALANWGIGSEFVTVLPRNDLAKIITSGLSAHKVSIDHIQYTDNRLGLYFVEMGSGSRPGKVIYDRANSAFANFETGRFDWNDIFPGATVFHWTGITPALSQNAANVCAEAIAEAKKRGITVICDLNYRKTLWQYGKAPNEVMPELVKHCDIICGNEEDAKYMLGITIDEPGAVKGHPYEYISRQIMNKYPSAKIIATTLRDSVSANHNNWSGVLWDGDRFYVSENHAITDVVDRFGAGDAFTAGLIFGVLNWKDDPQKILEFATAASCLKHTIPGDFNEVTLEEVYNLMSGENSGRVVR